jgi:hypothetical protein
METASSVEPKKTRKYSIIDRAKQAEATREVIENRRTQREVAEEYGVSRPTVQAWARRVNDPKSQVDPKVVVFYESPEGLAHLHGILVSAYLVFLATGGCGLPYMQKFLELSKLNTLAGSSIGALHGVSTQVNQQLVEFGKEERERLAEDMPPKEMTAAVDENFIMENMTLILMEPDSGFILTEQQEEKRDAATWLKVSQAATNGLNVKIVQVTGDEASGIIKYTQELLGAHKSSDLFHVQQDITRGLTSELSRRVSQAEKSLSDSSAIKKEKLKKLTEVVQATGSSLDNPAPQVARIGKQLLEEDSHEQKCQKALEEAKQNYQTARDARRAITTCYHPYDLSTGEARSPEQLRKELGESHEVLEEVSERIDSTEGQRKKLGKAKGAIESMVQTLAFFFRCLLQVMQRLGLDEQGRKAFECLVAIKYLQIALKRCADKSQKGVITQSISFLTSRQRDGPWARLAPCEQAVWSKKAKQCATLFQRSSSCVEGRNGVLSLKHHALHKLNATKSQALTVLHNFFTSRKDGTTAAERFFEKKQRNLFEWLLRTVDLPVRPRKRVQTWAQKEPENQAA